MSQAIIGLTEHAANHIRKMLNQEGAIGFRLAVKKTGCSGYAYVTDLITRINEEDTHCLVHDINIYLDKQSVPFLEGTTIDFMDQGMGQTKLLFHNPNAANLCGCGESFTLAQE